MAILWGDFETRSRCNLKTAGAYNYAQDASTEVLCFSYAFDEEPVQTWVPFCTDRVQKPPFPVRVVRHIESGGQLRFHNAGFDRLILEFVVCHDYGVPKPKLEQWYCTAAQARSNCLPGSLEDIGRAVSSNMRKDFRGSQLIRKMCVPPFEYTPALMAEMIQYCEQDVRAMRAISQALRSLSVDELADYHVNERINDRGVKLDMPLAQAAVRYAQAEQNDIQTLVTELSEGAITSVRSSKMRLWVQERLSPEARKVMWTGEKYSIDKTVRANLLQRDDLPPEVADVIQCADDIWASSVAKFNRLAGLADEDDRRVRGAFVFAGGGATGRACVDANTLVETEHGRAPIFRLQIGEKVLTHTGRLCKVSGKVYKGTETMYRVTTSSGAWIECTADHQLLTHLGWAKHEHQSDGITRSGYTVGSRAAIYDPALFTRHRDSRDNTDDAGHGLSDIAGGCPERQVKGVAFSQPSRSKDGGEESDVWGTEASGRDTAARVSVSVAARGEWVRARASSGANENAWADTVAPGMGSAPHRFEYTEQQPKQPSYSHVEWASNTSFAEITEIVCVGEKGVWDITVDGDASYCAQGLVHHNSSYGAQVHNFTRKCAKDPEAVRAAMVANHPVVPQFGRRVTDVLKGMLRPALVPAHGKMFFVADWVGIEARMNPWLSGNASDVLDVFRTGQDIYVREAQNIFNTREITPEQRQVGKVAVLACGYGGGHGAFKVMAKTYGVQTTEDEARKLVYKWRHANGWAVNYWSELEIAYLSAMKHPGQDFRAARVTYNFDGTHLWYDLPSGRRLCYPFARLNGDQVSYLKSSWKPQADAAEWPRHTLWKGLACENLCQAAANDILRHSLRQLEDVVLHIHDEIVVECDEDRMEEMRRVMCSPPPWAEGLPLDVEIKTMGRYGK